MVGFPEDRVGGDVDLVQVLVPIAFFLQLSQGRFKRVDNEARLVDIALTGGIDHDIAVVAHFDSRMVLDYPTLLDWLVPFHHRFNRTPVLLIKGVCLFQLRLNFLLILIGSLLSHLIQVLHHRSSFIVEDVFHVRNDLGVLLFLEGPAGSENNGAFINCSTHVFVDKRNLVDPRIELVVQNQLILLCSLLVFPTYRANTEHIVGT